MSVPLSAPGRRSWRDEPLVRAVAALQPDPGRTLLAVVTGTLALGCAIGLMAVSGWLISRAAQHPPVLYLQVAVVATRAFGVGRGVLRYVERLVSHDVALRGVSGLRERLYTRLAGADPAVVAGLRRGDLLARVGADVDALADVVVRSLLPIAVAWTTAAGSAVLVALLLPPAGLVVGAGLVVAAVAVPLLAARAARRAEADGSAARSALAAQALGVLDGVAELTVAGALPHELRRVAALDATLSMALDRAARPAAGAAVVGTLATGLGMVGALLFGVQAVRSGTAPLDPVLLAVVALTPLAAAEAIAGLPAAATALVRSRCAAQRVVALLDAPPATGHRATQEPAGAQNGSGATGFVSPMASPRLVATGLACGWPGRGNAVEGLDLDLAPGRKVAVVGPSGCGKTTLLLTLAGLLPARAGTVTLAGAGAAPRPLQDVPETVLRRTVSFTAEDAHVFTTSVRENVKVADPHADDAAILAALAAAGLGDWQAGLPRGLDTLLGSGGTGLSGGERRRLLLARAHLGGAGVLLLDEPGEHLDPQTADALVSAVLAPHVAASVVVVTHRLAPLAAADEVLVVAPSPDGRGPARVVARGTHTWLVAHHEPYRAALEAERGTRTCARIGA